eukprot:245401_1
MAAGNSKPQHLHQMLLVGIICFTMGFMCSYVSTTSSNTLTTNDNYPFNVHSSETSTIHNQISPRLPDGTYGRLQSLDVPEIPSLVLMGPPKAGSRTFINSFSKYNNVLQWHWERAFWCGANKLRCTPKQNHTEWTRYIHQFESNTATLAHLVEVIQSDKSNAKCTVKQNQYLWNRQEFNMTHKTCIHPKHAHDQNTLHHNFCYLVEKGPSQSRAPWVPILYANLMPKTKTFIIARNPIYHVMSCFVAFKKHNYNGNHIDLKHHIIDQIKQHQGFNVLVDICKDINRKWISYHGDGHGIKRFLQLKTDYKRFIVTYLWRKFVDPMDIQSRGLREDLFMWAPFTFPVFLISLFSHDEVLNNTVWYDWTPIQSYRVVQFEWLYADIPNAMKTIKCWVMELNTIECDTHLPDAQNRDIFESESIERHNHIENATVWQQPYAWYEDNIRQLFNPCYDTMQHILLYDRPHLLLGEWKSWNYSYTF